MADPKIVQRARNLFQLGQSYADIGRALGVSRQYIHQLIGPSITAPARTRKCRLCPARFQVKGTRKYCPSCSAKRKRESNAAAAYNRCACGGRKTKKASQCRNCHFGPSDLGLTVALYQQGYAVASIAGYFGVTIPAVYQAMHRKGLHLGHANRVARKAFERQPRIPIEQAAAEVGGQWSGVGASPEA